MKLGSTDISKIYLGSTEVSKAYLGSVQVHGGATPLAYDSRVEYLECTGTQYIDTDIIPVIGDAFNVEYLWTGGNILYYAGDGKNTYQCGFYCIKNGAYFKHFVSAGVPAYSFSHSFNVWYTLNVTPSGVATVSNGQLVSTPTGELTGDYTYLRLFGRQVGGGTNFSGKLKRFIITNNGVKHDLIPVRVGQVGYMYDRVTGALLGNAGTGSFVLGNDK